MLEFEVCSSCRLKREPEKEKDQLLLVSYSTVVFSLNNLNYLLEFEVCSSCRLKREPEKEKDQLLLVSYRTVVFSLNNLQIACLNLKFVPPRRPKREPEKEKDQLLLVSYSTVVFSLKIFYLKIVLLRLEFEVCSSNCLSTQKGT